MQDELPPPAPVPRWRRLLRALLTFVEILVLTGGGLLVAHGLKPHDKANPIFTVVLSVCGAGSLLLLILLNLVDPGVVPARSHPPDEATSAEIKARRAEARRGQMERKKRAAEKLRRQQQRQSESPRDRFNRKRRECELIEERQFQREARRARLRSSKSGSGNSRGGHSGHRGRHSGRSSRGGRSETGVRADGTQSERAASPTSSNMLRNHADVQLLTLPDLLNDAREHNARRRSSVPFARYRASTSPSVGVDQIIFEGSDRLPPRPSSAESISQRQADRARRRQAKKRREEREARRARGEEVSVSRDGHSISVHSSHRSVSNSPQSLQRPRSLHSIHSRSPNIHHLTLDTNLDNYQVSSHHSTHSPRKQSPTWSAHNSPWLSPMGGHTDTAWSDGRSGGGERSHWFQSSSSGVDSSSDPWCLIRHPLTRKVLLGNARAGEPQVRVKQKYCIACHVWREARASHCSSCGHCVSRFDHHCASLGVCVGHLNHRFFLLFMLCVGVGGISLFSLCIHALLQLDTAQRETWQSIHIYAVILLMVCCVPLCFFCGSCVFQCVLALDDLTLKELNQLYEDEHHGTTKTQSERGQDQMYPGDSDEEEADTAHQFRPCAPSSIAFFCRNIVCAPFRLQRRPAAKRPLSKLKRIVTARQQDSVPLTTNHAASSSVNASISRQKRNPSDSLKATDAEESARRKTTATDAEESARKATHEAVAV